MIKATILLLAACVVIPCLRRRSAAERHALWAAVLTMATVLPLLTWLLPSWEPDWARRAADTWPAAFETRSAVATAGDIVIRATGMESGWTRMDALLLLWVAGTTVLLAGLVAQVITLRRVASTAVATSERHSTIANLIAASLGLQPPRLTSSARVVMPLAWGVRRPRILLPDDARQWSDERVWAVCAHEIAHISRGDWITHLLAEVACRIYWFNPLFWVVRSRLGRESERAADDVVLGLGASGADYASHLLDIVRAAGPRQGLTPTVAMARLRAGRFAGARRGSGFERRVAALLSTLVNRARLTRSRAMVILIAAIVLAVPLAALGVRVGATIDVRTSNLPALEDVSLRDGLAGDGTVPVRELRVLEPMTAGRDEAPSVAEYTTPPLYSDEARRRAIEGVVVAQATIDARGRLSRARIVNGLGFGLDQNALVALRQWRFHPGSRDGVTVAMDVGIEIGFTLRADAINAQIANDMVSLVGPGVTPPKVVRVVNPDWRPVGAAGTVLLDVVLLEDGTPRIVRILRSLGADADDAAVRTFEQWRFSPAQQDGRAIKVRMNAAVRFHG